jgi:ribose transport system permease protein
MNLRGIQKLLKKFFSEYGMLGILILLMIYYSWATMQEHSPQGRAAAELVVKNIIASHPSGTPVLVAARDGSVDELFTSGVVEQLETLSYPVVEVIYGQPFEIRAKLEEYIERDVDIKVIATTRDYVLIIHNIQNANPEIGDLPVVYADSYKWPVFLQKNNLINVANQIVVIAIIAIGMTMVIITAGIDLSVGSLVALSAVVATMLIGSFGGVQATAAGMFVACLIAVLVCGTVGLFSGLMVSQFRVPPFIVTLGMMQVTSGAAYILADGRSIYEVPDTFIWLGRETTVFGLPNAVVLMVILYAATYVIMSRTTFGRHVYAVGGNEEASRLSGVRVKMVKLSVYAVSGIVAGLGGVILASQLKSGAPTYGLMYELQVIAAVVVGGTSLYGGQGKIIGTLIGALIIGVIQNGMNLTGVESYTQRVVLGLVIVGAVLLDRLRKR